MDCYIDIMLKPDSEMKENVLMSMVYTKFHKALVSLKSDFIGVSFPKYKVKLGCLMRIHGKQEELNVLQQLNWLEALIGYCEVSSIKQVPTIAKHRLIFRKRSNLTTSKLNRLIKRGSITEEGIKTYKAKMFASGLTNPFLDITSGSNGENHRRFFEFGILQDIAQFGKFDTFGLSNKATVPWF